jgi:hypothetical protein
MFDFNTLKFILIVAIILSSTFIISRNYFLKRYNKFEITIALSSLVIAIPLFIYANEINLVQKILTGIGILVIIIIVKYWDNLRGKNVKKVLGDPYDFEGKVQIYKSRNDIQLEDIIPEAKKELIILSVSNLFLVKHKEDVIIEAVLTYKLNITIWTLDPNSKFVANQSYVFGESVKEDIIESLELLEKLKTKLPKDKFTIKTYDSDLPHSLIVTDLNNEDSIAKIDKHVRDLNPDYRPSKAVFKYDNPARYQGFIEPLLKIQEIQH